MAEYCKNCKQLQDRLDEIAASRQSRSKALLAEIDKAVRRLQSDVNHGICGMVCPDTECREDFGDDGDCPWAVFGERITELITANREIYNKKESE